MAVIHISEEEAASNFTRVLDRVREGNDVRIDGKIAISAVASAPAGKKTLSEAIRLAKKRNLDVTLDGQFERDLDHVICNHEHEAGTRNLWEE